MMTDEQRLHMITEQLLIVRDNLFRGMSKSMQKLQAKSINEVLELPNFIESPQRTWVGLTTDDWDEIKKQVNYNFEMTTGEYAERISHLVEAKLKEKNT